MLKRLRQFGKDESGAVATLDAIIWIPLFLMLTLAVIDMAMIMMNHGRIQRIVNDAHRMIATGQITTCDAVEDFIDSRAQVIAPSSNAVCDSSGGSFIVAGTTVRSDEVDVSGVTTWLGVFEIRVFSEHTSEQKISS